jgi:hypothetical protein
MSLTTGMAWSPLRGSLGFGVMPAGEGGRGPGSRAASTSISSGNPETQAGHDDRIAALTDLDMRELVERSARSCAIRSANSAPCDKACDATRPSWQVCM